MILKAWIAHAVAAFAVLCLPVAANAQAGDDSALYVYARLQNNMAGRVPVEVLVTDPMGRRTGVDAAGHAWSEIPASNYGVDAIGDDEDASAGMPEVKSIEILRPVAGDYIVDVTETGTGPYALDFIAEDRLANPSKFTVAHTAAGAGARLRYRVRYDSAPGHPVDVTKVAR